MQTIIGSGGTIAIPLVKSLKDHSGRIRLVSRNPKRVNDTDELFALDVRNLEKIDEAVAGSEVVYITIGFEYKLSVWQNTWPPFMKAVIEACKRRGAKLVFFDNVYMYSQNAIPHMTEESRIDPPSKKGMVRREIQDMILDEVKAGRLTALIARSAHFYAQIRIRAYLRRQLQKIC